MNDDKKDQAELQRELDAAATQVTVGATYAHYKSNDNTYKITGLGFLEATQEICVIYEAQYRAHATFIRPLDVWLEEVEWNGQTVPRFKKIS